jgi:uncharacterized protein (TIGR00288 family)
MRQRVDAAQDPMANQNDIDNLAVFCDFENIALGVQDAKYEKFDIRKVLERLLLKGSIVVKKAYCDWARYKDFKPAMHEAAFELIEIPHVRQSGKNSADIRLVVDALDLCYTKAHVDAFVIVSGDSDFSPLVSKLRENNKHVIGVGVRSSTSDLLIKNCDEFIFYDDLVRADDQRRNAQRKAAERPAEKGEKADKPEKATRRRRGEPRKAEDAGSGANGPGAEAYDATETEGVAAAVPSADNRQAAIDLVMETIEALVHERGSDERIYGSMVKQALKRRRPDFNEAAYGYKLFGKLLEDAQARGLLRLTRDEKTGQNTVRLPSTDS